MTASPLTLGLFGLAAGAWALSFARPGWTAEARTALRRHRGVWLVVLGALLALGAADPLVARFPGALIAGAWSALLLPDLGRKVFPLLLGLVALLIPVIADLRLAPVGLVALAPVTRRVLGLALVWGGAALAGALAAAGAPAVWSTPDPRVPQLVTLMAGATLLATAGARATARRLPTPRWRVPLAWGWGPLVGGACLALLAVAPNATLALAVPLFPLAGALYWVASRREPADGGRGRGWGLALAGVLLLAFGLRWRFLAENPGWALPLSMDAQSYFDEALYLDRLIADRNTNLLALFFGGSTAFREPLFIFLMHGWLHLVGAREIHAVVLTVLAGTAWVGVSAFAVGLLLGRAAGLLAALLLAVDAIWIRNAAVGLREEVTGILLGLTIVVLWSPLPVRGRLFWAAPLLAGAAAVTRLDSLPFALAILIWAALAQRWSPVRTGAVLILLATLVVPTLAGHARSRGDAAPASTEIATNNWREVFKDRLGEPGFERDRRVSASEFLFRYFTPAQLVAYTASGYVRIYGEEVFESHYYLLANASDGWGRAIGLHSPRLMPALFVAGTLGLLWQRRRWRRAWLVPGLCVAGLLPPIGFVAGVPGHPELYQARYAYMVAPFAAGTVAWAVSSGGGWLARRLAVVAEDGAARLRRAGSPARVEAEEEPGGLAVRRGA